MNHADREAQRSYLLLNARFRHRVQRRDGLGDGQRTRGGMPVGIEIRLPTEMFPADLLAVLLQE